jgi:acetyl esterase/lipase
MTELTRGLAAAAISAVVVTLNVGCRGDAGTVPVSNDVRRADTATRPSRQTFVYKAIGNTAIKADVYQLAGGDRRPVIVWIHGGALIMGSRDMLPEDERERFLEAGYRRP